MVKYESLRNEKCNAEKVKIYRHLLWMFLFMSLTVSIYLCYLEFLKTVPSTLTIRENREETIDFQLPVSASIYEDSLPASSLLGSEGEEPVQQTIETTTASSFVMKANECNGYQMDVKLFGIVPVKTVDLEVVEETRVYPVGLPVGIYLKTEGVLVVDISNFEDAAGNTVEPAKYALRKGDYVLEVNGEAVKGKKELIQRIRKSNGEDMIFTLYRNGAKTQVKCTPVQSDDGEYKIGIWIRDSAQGIGTITYLDENGNFGALGHGINDVDTSELMHLKYGGIYTTDIIGIEKGEDGKPGELTGIISFDDEKQLGDVLRNTKGGIFGQLSKKEMDSLNLTSVEVGYKQEIQVGPAQILCKMNDENRLYDVEITKVNYESKENNRGIVLQITDQELLEETGGIVQGMSGSPIIQNGKIIGAVTHVFVNDPTKGYGIFIEYMLKQ